MVDYSNARVLMIATDGFEQDELFGPRKALLDVGVTVTLASLKTDPITGEKGGEKGESITPDALVSDVDPAEYQALVLPGGVGNPDTLRMDARTVEIVKAFVDADKIVAAICHAPWLLIEADVVDGKRATSWPSVRTDLANAGASVLDEEVVIDGKLITSRKPDDIPAFNRAVLEALSDA
ncbi:type 1 glutamine amidotransferase domain-containing protein [Sphingomonas sp. MMS12-HWE2-04]|uniref:type 1 glutamine amidotransferase domain-containing protein n=1 Tax=Sphingomonas sp. MMS12-HWE2-04 TaxID=3234199 RepID=UPI00384EDAF5